MSYNSIPMLKASLEEHRRQLNWHKNELAHLERAKTFTWTDEQFDQAEAMISQYKKEIGSLELSCRAIETELKRFSFKPATVAC